jgi:peptidyl-prolyl cis-trans isomerase C
LAFSFFNQEIFMNLFSRLLFLLVMTSTTLANAQATKKSDVPADAAAIVDGVVIKKSVIDKLISGLGNNEIKGTPEVRSEILNQLVLREVLAAEAVRKGTDKKSEFLARMSDEKQRVLSETFLTEYNTQNPVTEKEIQAEYERQKQALGGDSATQYLVSQIVLGAEQDARDAIARLKKGEAFEKLATNLSTDNASKTKGGQIGWVLPLELSPLLSNVIVNIPKGVYTVAPIQFNKAWHIFRVDDTRPYKIPTLEDSRQNLTTALQGQKRQKLIDELLKKATIQLGNP